MPSTARSTSVLQRRTGMPTLCKQSWHLYAGLSAGLLLAACSKPSEPTPRPEPIVSAAVPTSSSSAGSSATPPPVVPKTLVAVPHADVAERNWQLFPIEGALLVVRGAKIGRIDRRTIDWFADVPPGAYTMGPANVTTLGGSWPDSVDMTYQSPNVRAISPTYAPLTGKSSAIVFSSGNSMGHIYGTARVGDTTLVAGSGPIEVPGRDPHATGLHGLSIVSVRGPVINRTPTTKGWGHRCRNDPEERLLGPSAVVQPRLLASTRAGTLFLFGNHCETGKPAAQIWDDTGASRIVDLHAQGVATLDFSARLLRGAGDNAWLASAAGDAIHRYHKGGFEPLARLPKARQQAFVSAAGVLYASDGRTLYRYENEAWAVDAHFAWPNHFDVLTMHKDQLWGTVQGRLVRLQSSPALAFTSACKTPFVSLYEVSQKNAADFTFPTTRKALASFAHKDAIELVEETVHGSRQLGIVVADADQGKAVMEHIRASMKDEDPKLQCYSPLKPRKIAL